MTIRRPRLHYLWNTTNNNPFVGLGVKNLQSGQAFHANYAASYQVMKGIQAGFNGYWLQQLTDRQIDGKDVHNSKERTVGLGPGIQFAGSGLWFRGNSYLETGVRNRTCGTRVTFRIAKTLGSMSRSLSLDTLEPSAGYDLSDDD